MTTNTTAFADDVGRNPGSGVHVVQWIAQVLVGVSTLRQMVHASSPAKERSAPRPRSQGRRSGTDLLRHEGA